MAPTELLNREQKFCPLHHKQVNAFFLVKLWIFITCVFRSCSNLWNFQIQMLLIVVNVC